MRHGWKIGTGLFCVAIGIAVATGLAPTANAETIKIGVLPTAGTGPVFIAKDKGYFAAEGLDAQVVMFDAGQPVAVATVSGDLDFGAAGVSSALYTLAGQGALKLIAGFPYDSRGYHGSGVVASNKAYAAGLNSMKELGGHSVGLTQVGSTFHYALALVADHYGIDMKTMHLLPLQSLPNVATAVAGGQADAGLLIAALALPLEAKGQLKILGWVGDVEPWQVAGAWTSTKIANEHPDRVKGFLRAIRKASQDYYAAFIGPDGQRKDGPTAPEMLSIIGKYVKQTPAQMEISIGYVDPQDRLDIKDVARQIAWFRANGMIKDKFDVEQVIDRRYTVPLPPH